MLRCRICRSHAKNNIRLRAMGYATSKQTACRRGRAKMARSVARNSVALLLRDQAQGGGELTPFTKRPAFARKGVRDAGHAGAEPRHRVHTLNRLVMPGMLFELNALRRKKSGKAMPTSYGIVDSRSVNTVGSSEGLRWNTFFARSSPIVVISPMVSPSFMPMVDQYFHLGASDAESGRGRRASHRFQKTHLTSRHSPRLGPADPCQPRRFTGYAIQRAG
jgi:hypothetical protein